MTALEIQLADNVARHGEGVTEAPKKVARPRKGASPLGGKPASHPTPIASLERDPAINCRAGGVSEKLAAEYAEHLDALPPVVAFKDPGGKLWLADGFHRCRAHELAGRLEIAVDVREGDRRAALLHAAGANAFHGARRTNRDKRKAVLALLADPEWASKSDRWIAEQCSVHHELVGTARAQLSESAGSAPRQGKDGKVRRAPKKGKRSGFRRIPPAYRVASRALGKLSTAWARKQPIDALLAEVRGALEELERQHGAEDAR